MQSLVFCFREGKERIAAPWEERDSFLYLLIVFMELLQNIHKQVFILLARLATNKNSKRLFQT